jgi:hypothetical protein
MEAFFGEDAFTEPKLRTPKQIEDLAKTHGMKPSQFAPMIRKFEGGVILVPDEDPRPSVTFRPGDVFKNLDADSLPASEE